jgi:hypothetical protein
MRRVPLVDVCLMAKSLGVPDIAGFLAAAPDLPEPPAVDKAIRDLQALGALTPDQELTPLGRLLALLPGAFSSLLTASPTADFGMESAQGGGFLCGKQAKNFVCCRVTGTGQGADGFPRAAGWCWLCGQRRESVCAVCFASQLCLCQCLALAVC